MDHNLVKALPSILLFVGVVSQLVGCGGAYDASVTGTVTLDGEPLVGGHVTFLAVREGATAYGRTMLDGSYELQTGREMGLQPGEYVVTVVATTTPDPGDDEQIGELLTPARYNHADTSGLRFTVERGRNQIDLPLQTSP
jgi:hypothetical protein